MEKPKAAELVDVSTFNLEGVVGIARVERINQPAETLQQAAEIYKRDGIVALAPTCMIELADDNGQSSLIEVGRLTLDISRRTIARLQDIWRSEERDRVIKEKKFEAYNGTGRDMRSVSFANVGEHFDSVIGLQHRLTPTIRRIAEDPTVEVSTDPDEGTVINLQLFSQDSPADTRQEHGAHTDRVDTTVVICLDNVGPQGDFVYLKGYNEACRLLGLDPHRDFTGNMNRVLSEAPDSVIFRVYKVAPGRMLVIRTDQDVHLITSKSLADVQEGVQGGVSFSMLGDKVIGRGIINAAFETDRCRRVLEHSKIVYEKYSALADLHGDELFDALDLALRTEVVEGRLDETELEDVRNACVTKMSARQLYND